MKELIAEVKRSYGRALQNRQLHSRFYEIFINSHVDIPGKFVNTDFAQQHKLLDHSISLAMLFPQNNLIAKQAFSRIRESHNRHNLNIDPKYIKYWESSLLQAIAESDPEFSPELREKWCKVLEPAISYIKEGY